MALSAKRSWDVPWADRAREEAANLNPAFCGELLASSVSEYNRLREIPFPFALVFIVLPISLHRRTRDLLPRRTSTAFVSWIAENKASLVEIPDRVLRLMPVTREALLFGLQHHVLHFERGGLISPARRRVRLDHTTDDSDQARRTAAMLGRWFAAQGSTSSIMQGFGITP